MVGTAAGRGRPLIAPASRLGPSDGEAGEHGVDGRASRRPCPRAAAGVLSPAGGPRGAQGVVKNTFGDWQMRCETPAGAKAEQCALVQNVAAEDRPNMTLLVIVLKTADQKSRLLRVVAPLGVLLPSGLGLKIDDRRISAAPASCAA